VKDKRESQKRPKDMQPARTKERRELVPLVVGSYLIHSLLTSSTPKCEISTIIHTWMWDLNNHPHLNVRSKQWDYLMSLP
jgi:hypothetical protein